MKVHFYPLIELRFTVTQYICNSTARGNKLFEKAIDAITILEHQLADLMLSGKSDDILKRYVRIIQESVRKILDQVPISWIDELEISAPKDPVNTPTRRAYICFELYRMLKSFQTEYPKYFNDQSIAPDIYTEIERSVYIHKKMLVLPWLEGITGDNIEFYNIIFQYMKHIWNKKMTLTYQQLDYCWNLINQLYYQWQLNHQAGMLELHALMVCINFNDMSFFTYLTRSISKDLEALDSDEEKYALLIQEQKSLSKIMERNDTVLDPGFPSLKEMLSSWLKAEITVN